VLMKLLRINFLFLVVILTYSCTKSPVIETQSILTKNDVLIHVYETNPSICMIKSRGIFFYENRFNRIKFKGTIHKTCESNVTINVLGMFGQVYIQATYDGSNFNVIKDDKDISEEYSSFFNEEQIRQLVKLLNIPAILPDDSFFMQAVDGYYFFEKGDKSIFVNKSFKIERIRKKDIVINYYYDSDTLKEIEYTDAGQMFDIKLNNPDFGNN